MERLRQSPRLTRTVLVWFMLFMAASVASAIVHPTSTQVVCSGSGVMKIVVIDESGNAEVKLSSAMDCPLCAPLLGATPDDPRVSMVAVPVTAMALLPAPTECLPFVTAPPLPSRGPPSLS